MFRTVSQRVVSAASASFRRRPTLAVNASRRAFASKTDYPPDEGHIHGEREGLTGIARKEEVVHQTMGEDVDIFDRDATAFEEEGTKENPIVILSNESSRIVGISLPDDAFCRYFVLEEGKIMHDPVTNNYLVLRKVDDAAVDQQIESVDKELGDPKAGE